MDKIRKRLLDFLVKEVKDSKEQINTMDIILDFLKNEFHEEDEIERLLDELSESGNTYWNDNGASESNTMVSNGGFIYDYPTDDEEFLEKLCRDLVYDYRNDDKQLEEVIKRYNNHPHKEDLGDCIEDITEGKIQWEMTVDHNYGFTDGYGDWIFPA